ncbi:YdiU family protein [Anabaenopsis tanganyikae CS-531]|uniref:Protein nucleotidyltransferase YdiU n=2 Tax=Anabaenopsis TaxID=110103 RepID=A0ABT5AWL7_9CYAN|nr:MULTISPECIES: YdiU family protein [Anabaenopsis]MDB9540740.1 YdiU family protein [Anabaenopsis arnoldii]MDH6093178.1 YdiU family protein [Anabaenopsis arnoldii]MDH6105670.1 YdiU family protein [Anabaenopsis tanganyikae CS-531]
MNLAETPNKENSHNPFLTLNYEPALESLGDDYYDEVIAADFPQHILRWRNDSLLPLLGLDPHAVTDENFINAFGKFQQRRPLLALRYHGYQFGTYNPDLGDGRGFLYGQVRGADGQLYDFGTKGSGKTPYSRGGDGMLTLKGGVREVLAAEALHQLGVRTSRCLTMIETGLSLWRGDEPSPTRSSVMVRVNSSHIRFGTFERLHYFQRPDLTQKLLDHVIQYYYPHLQPEPNKYVLFYAELVKRVAQLVAQWMAVGFCHAVLNTDNMSITGESFDYGPYAFIPTYDPYFTAAYFDYYRRYCYSHQPSICQLNLELLQEPLQAIIDKTEMDSALGKFNKYYQDEYRSLMLKKLGFEQLDLSAANELLNLTIQFLQDSQVGYHQFFWEMARTFTAKWRDDPHMVMNGADIIPTSGASQIFENWCLLYHQILNSFDWEYMDVIAQTLVNHNPQTALLRPVIESVWEPIAQENNWHPFNDLVQKIQSKG